MDDKTEEAEVPEEMTIEDFQEMSEGIATGIDSLLANHVSDRVDYVLCLNHRGLKQMGVVTNASPLEALRMVTSVSHEMHREVNKTEPATKSKIVIPH